MNKILLTAAALTILSSANAQQKTPANIAQKDSVTFAEYSKAESFLDYNTRKLIDEHSVKPNWLKNDSFWYSRTTNSKQEFILVNPINKTRKPAFDHQKLATALTKLTGASYEASALPIQSIGFSDNLNELYFYAEGKSYQYDLKTNVLALDLDNHVKATPPALPRSASLTNGAISPDGNLIAFIKDYNLFVQDKRTNKQVQLTTDGVKDFGYATDNAGWSSSDKAILRWSPDSRKIATFKQDQRKVGDMYLVTTNVGHPVLHSWKYPLPGDKEIAMIHRVIIDVTKAAVIALDVPADPHRSSLGDDISDNGILNDVDWSPDAKELAFLSTSRDHKEEKFRIADAATGKVREVFKETVATQFESGQESISWRYLSESKEIIWYSEQNNWGHLYLYNSQTGKLKNQITKGDWVVNKLVKIDQKKREIYFIANGKEAGNPYFAHFYKIGFDGKNLVSLTPELGNHQISLSPTGQYFIDTYSQPNVPSVTTIRNMNGRIVSDLEKTDVSRLVASGWKAPTPVKLKAADNKTDVYGLVFTPTKQEANKKYPVIDYIYPGPQGGSIGSWSFSASKGGHQALAELGFIVVVLEGSGNPLRSKSFHDASYGNMSINTLPDQIKAIRQLSSSYPIDTTKVGIWGHSGGGFATATAMFKYPDFFKVGIAESGNHDNRNYEDDWGERYDGLAENSDYEAHSNQLYAKNLKGKLLLAHGMMDNNVPPSNTMLVADALIKANKDFDLLIFPNSKHGYGAFSPYMMRRRWDYFVKNLLEKEPPREFPLRGTNL
jgi:dipeptidyl aminopeptidase/acylaminoacyl peptidase